MALCTTRARPPGLAWWIEAGAWWVGGHFPIYISWLFSMSYSRNRSLMILVWPRGRHICCMQGGFAQWGQFMDDHYRRKEGRDMGTDIAIAAKMGLLQCDIERQIMLIAGHHHHGFLSIFPSPRMMRAVVTVQRRQRYRMWRARYVRSLAVAMALHPRLGNHHQSSSSLGGVLDQEIVRLICHHHHI